MITVKKSNSRLKTTAVLLCLFVAVQGCKSTRRSAPASAPAQIGSNPRDTIIAKISAQGERLPDSDFAREIFDEKFDPRTHMSSQAGNISGLLGAHVNRLAKYRFLVNGLSFVR